MGRFLPIFLAVMLIIYCLVEVAQAPSWAVRRMPRWLWATAIVFLPVIGAAAWLLFGRPNAESRGEKTTTPGRPSSPDDDPDFLRGL